MPVIAAAVCPHPPLLVPAVAAGAAAELDHLRAACDGAVAALLGCDPDLVTVVGGAAATVRRTRPYGGSLAPWGLDETVGEPGGALPLSLLIGAWLLSRQPSDGTATAYQEVDRTATPSVCADLGAALGAEADRVALLVMGDGSACRSDKAPGYADPRAEPFDAAVTSAFTAGDPTALGDLDPTLAAELLVGGRAPWQVLAGATAGRRWQGRVEYDAAPYGVHYLVARWQ